MGRQGDGVECDTKGMLRARRRQRFYDIRIEPLCGFYYDFKPVQVFVNGAYDAGLPISWAMWVVFPPGHCIDQYRLAGFRREQIGYELRGLVLGYSTPGLWGPRGRRSIPLCRPGRKGSFQPETRGCKLIHEPILKVASVFTRSVWAAQTGWTCKADSLFRAEPFHPLFTIHSGCE